MSQSSKLAHRLHSRENTGQLSELKPRLLFLQTSTHELQGVSACQVRQPCSNPEPSLFSPDLTLMYSRASFSCITEALLLLSLTRSFSLIKL